MTAIRIKKDDDTWEPINAGPSGITLATSTTRPAHSPGLTIFETDTNRYWHSIKVAGFNYWAPPPGTVVFHANCYSAATSLPTGAATALPWNEVIDLYDCFTSGASAVDYTPPVPGLYLLTGGGSFSTDTTGDYRSVSWYIDGATAVGGTASHLHSAISRFPIYPARPLPVRLTGANAVSLRLQHNASGPLTLGGGANTPTMTATYVGP